MSENTVILISTFLAFCCFGISFFLAQKARKKQPPSCLEEKPLSRASGFPPQGPLKLLVIPSELAKKTLVNEILDAHADATVVDSSEPWPYPSYAVVFETAGQCHCICRVDFNPKAEKAQIESEILALAAQAAQGRASAPFQTPRV